MQSNSRQSGFTLLEIVITLAIVGGFLVTLIYTLNYHLTLAERQESSTMAHLLAKDKMEEMERNPGNAKGEFPEPYSNYRYVTEIKSSLHPDMSEIHVGVSDGSESAKLVELIERKE